jgi:hypothetical protein
MNFKSAAEITQNGIAGTGFISLSLSSILLLKLCEIIINPYTCFIQSQFHAYLIPYQSLDFAPSIAEKYLYGGFFWVATSSQKMHPKNFQPTGRLSKEEISTSLENLTRDGVCSQTMTVLAGGPILIAFALALGADNAYIGAIAALPFLAQFIQIPAIYLYTWLRKPATESCSPFSSPPPHGFSSPSSPLCHSSTSRH